jgi:hypothetical protein
VPFVTAPIGKAVERDPEVVAGEHRLLNDQMLGLVRVELAGPGVAPRLKINSLIPVTRSLGTTPVVRPHPA